MTLRLTPGGRARLTTGNRLSLTDGSAGGGGGTPSTGADAITGVDLPSDQIYQASGLGGPAALIPVSALYAGATGIIQASVVTFGTSTLAPGATWQTISASGGVASGAISVPRGGPYAL